MREFTNKVLNTFVVDNHFEWKRGEEGIGEKWVGFASVSPWRKEGERSRRWERDGSRGRVVGLGVKSEPGGISTAWGLVTRDRLGWGNDRVKHLGRPRPFGLLSPSFWRQVETVEDAVSHVKKASNTNPHELGWLTL